MPDARRVEQRSVVSSFCTSAVAEVCYRTVPSDAFLAQSQALLRHLLVQDLLLVCGGGEAAVHSVLGGVLHGEVAYSAVQQVVLGIVGSLQIHCCTGTRREGVLLGTCSETG